MHLLTRFALGRRSVTVLLVLVVFLLGLSTWSTVPAELFPELKITSVQIVTFLPGSNPDAVVADVTDPIEDAITGIRGLDSIESTSSANRSVIFARFSAGTDMDEAESDVVSAVAGVNLPDQATPPLIQKIDPNSIPIVQVSVLSNSGRPIPELQRIIEDLAIPRLEQVEGTFRVDLVGEVDEQIIVEADLDRLDDLGLSLNEVANALSANNVSLPAGDIDDRGRNYVLRTTHELGSLEEIENVVIGLERISPGQQSPSGDSLPSPGGEERRVLLKDVADVRLGTANASSISRTNGRPSLSIAVSREEGANTVDVSSKVLATLEEVEGSLPQDIEFITISNDGPAVVREVSSLVRQGVQGFFSGDDSRLRLSHQFPGRLRQGARCGRSGPPQSLRSPSLPASSPGFFWSVCPDFR